MSETPEQMMERLRRANGVAPSKAEAERDRELAGMGESRIKAAMTPTKDRTVTEDLGQYLLGQMREGLRDKATVKVDQAESDRQRQRALEGIARLHTTTTNTKGRKS